MARRVFENPLIKDRVTILKTHEETNGKYMLVEVELQAGGGNIWHYHTSFTEEFTAVEGVLGIGLEKTNYHLQPGENATAPKGKLHRFYNPGNTPIRFHVKMTPAREEFIQSLSIGYGLAGDGLTNKKGIPKKLDHLAYLLEISDTRFTGFLSLITPLLLRRAQRAKKRGIHRELLAKYY